MLGEGDKMHNATQGTNPSSHNTSVLNTGVLYKTFLYYGTEGVAVNVSTVIDHVQSLQEDCRAKPLQKHWVDSKFM